MPKIMEASERAGMTKFKVLGVLQRDVDDAP